MQHKRWKQGDGDACVPRKGTSDDHPPTDVSRWLSAFGGESVHAIREGNPVFARGGFGEVSIATWCRGSKDGGPDFVDEANNNNANNNAKATAKALAPRHSFVAVKTIHNAIEVGGGAGAGGPARPSPGQKLHALFDEVRNEVRALRLLEGHPNIVPLVAVFPGGTSGSLSLAFSYAPIDLREVLEERRRAFRQPLAFRFLRAVLRDVFSALVHCHARRVLHGDVKPGNLLVAPDGTVQLCDFGLAKPFGPPGDGRGAIPAAVEGERQRQQQYPTATNNDRGLCTLHYRPPEVLLGGSAGDPSVDLWSAGVVLAELVAGRPLWQGRNVIDQLSAVFGSLGTPDETTWRSVTKLPDYGKLGFGTRPPKPLDRVLPRAAESQELVDLASNLLVLNPERRLTASEALHHGWCGGNTAGGPSPVVATRREVRDELIVPREMQVPPLLFPGDRVLVGKLGLGIAASRRSVNSKRSHGCWQGPVLPPPVISE